MKNQLIPFLFTITFLFAVIACNKEDVNSYKAEDIALASDSSPSLYTAELVFHISEVDLLSGEESGWVIDRLGMVRAYQITKSTSEEGVIRNDVLTTTQLNALNAAAQEVVFEVPEDEMSTMSSLIQQVDANALSDTEKGADASSLTTIYAFRLMPDETTEHWEQEESYISSDNEEESCGGQLHSNSYLTDTNFERLVIRTSGASTKNNTSEASKSIGDWISDINENNNL